MAFIKKAAALVTVSVFTVATLVLLIITFDRGGRWFILLIVWMPIFYVVCSRLGFPVKSDKGPTADPSDFL